MRLKLNRGFDEVREEVNARPKVYRNCNSCKYYYCDKGDTEEVCQNEKVLEYDIVVDGNITYCNYWKPVSSHRKGYIK